MFNTLRIKIAKFIAPEYVARIVDLEKRVDNVEERIQQRIAKTLLDLDPMEMVLRQYHGVFSEQFERPEERLNAQGRLGMMMWGYQQKNDPYFKHMTDWLLNTQGNNTIRKAKNEHEWFFGRASIVNIELFIKEVGRLSNLYEEMLERQKEDPNFKSELPIE